MSNYLQNVSLDYIYGDKLQDRVDYKMLEPRRRTIFRGYTEARVTCTRDTPHVSAQWN